MARVICKSGFEGEQSKLQSRYKDFEEFEGYCENYNLHKRLGFSTAKKAWKANPLVQSSTFPSDFCKVTPKQAEEGLRLYRNKRARERRNPWGQVKF